MQGPKGPTWVLEPEEGIFNVNLPPLACTCRWGSQGHLSSTHAAGSGARCVCPFTAQGKMDVQKVEAEGTPAAGRSLHLGPKVHPGPRQGFYLPSCYPPQD